ncbi:hypothetical protein C7212DRAFT_343018 [Tuber magnatum]|uniref:Uncharacterized protein n=1 Tax=Tuber magnatum TaxID=42249 RepID=A0A317SUA6_9PEZI|nr:hypothetical protein C7212DRAFT_343018 [Tuber magnatum]
MESGSAEDELQIVGARLQQSDSCKGDPRGNSWTLQSNSISQKGWPHAWTICNGLMLLASRNALTPNLDAGGTGGSLPPHALMLHAIHNTLRPLISTPEPEIETMSRDLVERETLVEIRKWSLGVAGLRSGYRGRHRSVGVPNVVRVGTGVEILEWRLGTEIVKGIWE